MMPGPADSQLPGPSQAVVRTDWSKCILCQKVTSEIFEMLSWLQATWCWYW